MGTRLQETDCIHGDTDLTLSHRICFTWCLSSIISSASSSSSVNLWRVCEASFLSAIYFCFDLTSPSFPRPRQTNTSWSWLIWARNFISVSLLITTPYISSLNGCEVEKSRYTLCSIGKYQKIQVLTALVCNFLRPSEWQMQSTVLASTQVASTWFDADRVSYPFADWNGIKRKTTKQKHIHWEKPNSLYSINTVVK